MITIRGIVGSVVLLGTAATLAAQDNVPKNREVIGEVFGKPVYRDEIRTGKNGQLRSELHRLFLAEPMRKYHEAHKAEITPTEAELAAVMKFFDASHTEKMREEEPKLRAKLKTIERQLSEDKPDDAARKKLEIDKRVIEAQLKPPGRQFAMFMLDNWKFQKHLYDTYGGGRILWQQAGQEAFDAHRKWLEAMEQRGDFKITDPKLRETFYEYWTTMNHGAFLTGDRKRIETEFLKPEWLHTADNDQ